MHQDPPTFVPLICIPARTTRAPALEDGGIFALQSALDRAAADRCDPFVLFGTVPLESIGIEVLQKNQAFCPSVSGLNETKGLFVKSRIDVVLFHFLESDYFGLFGHDNSFFGDLFPPCQFKAMSIFFGVTIFCVYIFGCFFQRKTVSKFYNKKNASNPER